MAKIWLLGLALCVTCKMQAQLLLGIAPKEGALVARNVKTNLGEIRLQGTVDDSKYGKLQCRVWQNGKAYATFFHTLSYTSGIANFDLKIKLKAGKFRYNILLEIIDKDTIRKWIRDVVIGDVFIIQGQSNAVANAFLGNANPTYADSFIRSFGSSTYSDYDAFNADSFWHIANGDGAYTKGCIGQWGLVMARSLLDSFGIPIAIFNGAIGGTSVAFHQRYEPQPTNIYTCYGRLLTRLKMAGLDKNVRSIFWFQGETDGTQPKMHDSLFRILYSKWALDYKEAQQNYLVQVRGGGCGDPTAEMLEVQRQFEFTLKKLKVVSTNGLNAHDGCHYWFKNGYEQLGFQFAALAARDLYGSSRTTNIDPPQIRTAYFSNGDFSEVVLEMEHPEDSIYADAGFQNLFFVSGDNTLTITGGRRHKNKIYLQFNKGTCNTIYLSYMGKSWVQPWVKNQFGMGLIGFHLIPVQKIHMRTIFSGCPGKPIELGEDSVSGFKYKWLLPDGKIRTTAKILENLKKDANYKLVVSYPGIGCKPDSFQIAAVFDKTENPNLGADSVLCNGVSITWKLDGLFSAYEWKQNTNLSLTSDFETDTGGAVILNATSSLGCSFADTVLIRASFPEVHIAAPSHVCPDTDTLLSADMGFAEYSWNGQQTNYPFHRSGAGAVIVHIADSLGCNASDTVWIAALPVPPKPNWKFHICPYDSVSIAKPAIFSAWFLNTTPQPNNIYLKPNGYVIKLEDSNGCSQTTKAEVIAKEVPLFSLGNDTTVCPGNPVEWRCSYLTANYYWNGSMRPSHVFRTTDSGLVHCTVLNGLGCSFSDSAYVFYKEIPFLKLPKDTVLCIGKVWKPDMLINHKYKVNGNPVSSLQFSSSGIFRVTVENQGGCTAEADMEIRIDPCISGIRIDLKEDALLYPNPCTDFVLVPVALTGKQIKFTDISGRKILELEVPSDGKVDLRDLPNGAYMVQSEAFFWHLLKQL